MKKKLSKSKQPSPKSALKHAIDPIDLATYELKDMKQVAYFTFLNSQINNYVDFRIYNISQQSLTRDMLRLYAINQKVQRIRTRTQRYVPLSQRIFKKIKKNFLKLFNKDRT